MRALMNTPSLKLNWDKILYQTFSILRTRKNRATNYTPSHALLGYTLPRPGQWQIAEYRRRRDGGRQSARRRRRNIRSNTGIFQRQNYPRQRHTIIFREGDQVMVKNYRYPHPLDPPWRGPFSVLRVKAENVYDIEINGIPVQYHVDQLRPVPMGNPIPSDHNASDYSDSEEDTSSSEDEVRSESSEEEDYSAAENRPPSPNDPEHEEQNESILDPPPSEINIPTIRPIPRENFPQGVRRRDSLDDSSEEESEIPGPIIVQALVHEAPKPAPPFPTPTPIFTRTFFGRRHRPARLVIAD